MAKYYANPYDTSARGFYFTDFEDFEAKLHKETLRSGAEEYEIDFIDDEPGDPAGIAELFDIVQPDQSELAEWLEYVEDVPDAAEMAALSYLIGGVGYTLVDAIGQLESKGALIHEGTLEDYVYDLSSAGVPPATVELYFDYAKFGRDLAMDLTSDDNYEGSYYETLISARRYSDLAETWIDDTGGLSDLGSATLLQYFDVSKFARDLQLNGDAYEFVFDGQDWVIEANAY